jgi:hypothetical protein
MLFYYWYYSPVRFHVNNNRNTTFENSIPLRPATLPPVRTTLGFGPITNRSLWTAYGAPFGLLFGRFSAIVICCVNPVDEIPIDAINRVKTPRTLSTTSTAASSFHLVIGFLQIATIVV